MSESRKPVAERSPRPPPTSGREAASGSPRGPIVLNGDLDRRGERVFGGATPDGPLPGRLLVLLSRLHRAESAPRVQAGEGAAP